jgi:L-threonylcarbamoyladenylate synthase
VGRFIIKYMRLTRANQDDVALKAAEALRKGEVILHPTETVYGLACDPKNEEALKLLYEIKNRLEEKPVSVMVDSIGMADKYGIFSNYATSLLDQFWPGPVSVMVLKRRGMLPEFFNPGHKFVAIRYSNDSFCQDLVEKFGGPIVTTSANLSDKPACYKVQDVKKQLGVRRFGKLGLVVDEGKLEENPPSTIVKIVGDTTVFVRGDGSELGGIMR